VAIPPDVLDEILAALNERLDNKTRPCPICGQLAWGLEKGGFVTVVLTDKPLKLALGGKGLPLVVLGCQNCGNSVLINLYTLGLGDLIDRLAVSDG
jgi:ribosomal protein S27AE